MIIRKKNKTNQMWGGHYSTGPAEILKKINASISFDKKLYAEDIAGSKAHAAMLVKCKIITASEGAKIAKGLDKILGEIKSGKFKFKEELEDIHMNIEARLAEIIGPVAGKLHTARSRNDQVATDFRLWVIKSLEHFDLLLQKLQSSLIKRAEEYVDAIMPGFTHLQPAQPITLGHHLMAYVEMFGRDRARMLDAAKRAAESPLGAAALAGTGFPIDRYFTAETLGFDAPMANSLDAVSDRDFVLEYLAAAAITSVHLSRLAEEFILWSTPNFSFIKLSESFTTGSSIMPQKRNPDAAELVRGKTGRLFGALISLLTTMKALTLAYSKDMQEDKEVVFSAEENLTLCLVAMEGMVADFSANKKRLLKAANKGYLAATDLADWLVKKYALPFREAHHITGRIVTIAENKGSRLEDVQLKEMQRIFPKITKEVYDVIALENAVNARKSFGGTAPEQVKKAIKEAKKKYLN